MLVKTLPTMSARLLWGVELPRLAAPIGVTTGGDGFSPGRSQFR